MRMYKVKATYFGTSITFYIDAETDADAIRTADEQARETFRKARGYAKEQPMAWTEAKIDITREKTVTPKK